MAVPLFWRVREQLRRSIEISPCEQAQTNISKANTGECVLCVESREANVSNPERILPSAACAAQQTALSSDHINTDINHAPVWCLNLAAHLSAFSCGRRAEREQHTHTRQTVARARAGALIDNKLVGRRTEIAETMGWSCVAHAVTAVRSDQSRTLVRVGTRTAATRTNLRWDTSWTPRSPKFSLVYFSY